MIYTKYVKNYSLHDLILQTQCKIHSFGSHVKFGHIVSYCVLTYDSRINLG